MSRWGELIPHRDDDISCLCGCQEENLMTASLFVPPAAAGLPLAALDSATDGASALDASARTPYGRNLLAHALVQLARDGWLRLEPGQGFEPVRDRETSESEADVTKRPDKEPDHVS